MVWVCDVYGTNYFKKMIKGNKYDRKKEIEKNNTVSFTLHIIYIYFLISFDQI